MKKIFISSLASVISFMLVADTFAQLPEQAKMTSTTESKSSLKDSSSIDSLRQTPKKKERKESLPTPVAAPRMVKEHAAYLHPGILVNLGGRWEGSDHLLNISSNIGVYVTIVKPEGAVLGVTEAQIQKEVEAIFTQSHIKPQNLVAAGKPALPAFQVEIFVYPIEKGYVAYCGGTLFESVVLDRFKMDSNMAFQAITWEKQNLIVSPEEQFVEQLTKTVQDIASTFTERYEAYERIKLRQ